MHLRIGSGPTSKGHKVTLELQGHNTRSAHGMFTASRTARYIRYECSRHVTRFSRVQLGGDMTGQREKGGGGEEDERPEGQLTHGAGIPTPEIATGSVCPQNSATNLTNSFSKVTL